MKLSFFFHRSRTRFRRFTSDERGAVLIYVSLMLPLFIGLSLLAVDGARVYNLGTELQKAADALALAGAAELDRRPDAITRAKRAITNMLENEQRFAAGAARISYRDGDATSDVTLRFLKDLPISDADPIETEHEADGASEAVRSGKARFVEVTVNPKTLTTILPAGFIGGATSVQSSAKAVAGFTSVVCRTTPMFICNPWEGTSTSIFDTAAKGKQIKMQLGNGGDAQYFPGNYGWLRDPSIGNGAAELRDALARVNPPACFEQDGVVLQTGNIENANKAINVRFDLWDGPFNNESDNPEYRPAQNVRKGYAPGPGGNACNPEETPATPNSARLGRDTFASGSRLGSGLWDVETYWSTNYPGQTRPTGWNNISPPSRYDVYRHEVASIGGGGVNLVNLSSVAPYNERGNPMCYTGGGLSDVVDRRLVYAAIINCSELNIRGSSAGRIPVLAFGKFFLTEPVAAAGQPDGGVIFSEFVDVIRPGSVGNEVARDKVQLYR